MLSKFLSSLTAITIVWTPLLCYGQVAGPDRTPIKLVIQSVPAFAPPLTLKTLLTARIGKDSTPNRIFPDAPTFHRSTQPKPPVAQLASVDFFGLGRPLGDVVGATVATFDGGGQSGINIDGGSGYSSIYANLTAITDLSLDAPPNAVNQNMLYAPTLHGSDGNCLEVGSDYWTTYGYPGTGRAFRLYDFCNGVGWNTNISKPIDATFVNNYVRTLADPIADKRAYYTVQLWKEGDGAWHLNLYNYSTSTWEDLYSSTGSTNYNGGQGWAIYETHYTPGRCSPIPGAAAFQVQFDSTLAGSASGVTHPNFGPCFTDTTSPHYVVSFPSGDTWTSLTY